MKKGKKMFKSNRISRSSRRLGAAVASIAAGSLLLVGCSASAEPGDGESDGEQSYSGTLTVASFGGSFDEALKKVVVQPFEEKFGVKVEVVTALTTEVIASLQAQGAGSGYDVVQFSGGQEEQAYELGLISELNAEIATNAANVDPAAKRADGEIAPAYAFNTTGIIYNTETFSEAPTSWDVLSDPEHQGRVGIPDISVTAGQNLLISLARINGGDENDIQPGFDALPELIENAHSVYGDGPTMTNLLGQDEIDLAVFDSGYGYLLAKKGLPVRFAVPETGGVLYGLTSQVVKGSAQENLAWEWINFQLDPAVQVAFAEEAGYAPTNVEAEVPAELAELLVLADAIDRVEPVDTEVVSLNRPAWVEEWNKIISKS